VACGPTAWVRKGRTAVPVDDISFPEACQACDLNQLTLEDYIDHTDHFDHMRTILIS